MSLSARVALAGFLTTFLATCCSADFASIEPIVAGEPEAGGEAPAVIALLLHGNGFDKQTWTEDPPGTLAALSEAGILTVAIDVPGRANGPALADDVPLEGIIDFVFDTYRTPGAAQATVVVAPSASGSVVVPYIDGLNDTSALTGFVCVACVSIDDWTGPPSATVVQELQVAGIYGTLDSTYLPDLDVLDGIFPNFTPLLLEGAGHASYIDEPALFNQFLIDFAQNLTASAAASPAAGPAGASGADAPAATGGGVAAGDAAAITTATDGMADDSDTDTVADTDDSETLAADDAAAADSAGATVDNGAAPVHLGQGAAATLVAVFALAAASVAL